MTIIISDSCPGGISAMRMLAGGSSRLVSCMGREKSCSRAWSMLGGGLTRWAAMARGGRKCREQSGQA